MSKPNNIGIYAWICKIDGKALIGQSHRISRRKWEHRRLAVYGQHHNAHFQNAWNKYGETNFDFVVLELIDDLTRLTVREQHWVDHYRSEKSGVYNQAGPVDSPTRGVKWSIERRLTKLGKPSPAKGYRFTPGQRAYLSSRMLGRNRSLETIAKTAASNRGKKRTDASKLKMSLARKGREALNKKAIIGINCLTGEQLIYLSITEAKRDGFSQSQISACINGRGKTAGGYHWELLETEPAITPLLDPSSISKTHEQELLHLADNMQ